VPACGPSAELAEGDNETLPLSDGIPARRFPIVNAFLIVANVAVWIIYELPQLNTAVYHASFYPCTVEGACHGPEPRAPAGSPPCSCMMAGITSRATCCSRRSSEKNAEDALGPIRYLVFYFAGGLPP